MQRMPLGHKRTVLEDFGDFGHLMREKLAFFAINQFFQS